ARTHPRHRRWGGKAPFVRIRCRGTPHRAAELGWRHPNLRIHARRAPPGDRRPRRSTHRVRTRRVGAHHAQKGSRRLHRRDRARRRRPEGDSWAHGRGALRARPLRARAQRRAERHRDRERVRPRRPLAPRALAARPEIRMSFSAGGLCTSVALGAEQMLLYYDPVGREVARELPGGGEFTHEYDRVGRIVRQAYTPPKPQALASVPPPPPRAPIPSSRPRAWERRFDYDSGGHIRWIEDSLRGSVWAFHDPVGELRALFR